MKRLALRIGIILTLLVPTGAAFAQVPFGGPIISMRPCYYPWGGWQITLGPPTPGTYLYQWGLSRSFLFGPPIHPGQYLLGVSTGVASCASYYDDGWRGWRSGGLILFHGSSV